MSQEILHLKKAFLFQGLPDDVLDALAQKISHRRLTKDEVLFRRGDQGDALYIIDDGWVKIVREDDQGRELVLNRCGPGEAFGEMSLLDQEPRSAGVVALMDTDVLELNQDSFLELLDQRPDVALNLIRSISSRLRFSGTYIQKVIEWSKKIADGDYSSFRGGTGKSNTTANLAAQTALTGKRVGVVDTDIQSPGIHVLFGLDENTMGKTLNDFLHGQCEIKEVAFSVGEHAGGVPGRAKLAGKNLWLIPSSIRGREISRVLREGYDVGRLNEGLQTLITELNLDYLFIDTHPGLNEETLLSIAISDILIIILRPDNQDFQGTAVTVDIARSLDVTNLFLMVNKAVPNRYDYADLKQQVEKNYGAPLTGILPLSFDIADNASKDLFSLAQPDHDWSRELRKVVDAILEVK